MIFFYYIPVNTNEILGDLAFVQKHHIFTPENDMLFSHVKRSHCYHGNVINHSFTAN